MREFISGFKILPFYTTEASESKDRLLCGNCSRKRPTVIVSFSLFLQRYTHIYIYCIYVVLSWKGCLFGSFSPRVFRISILPADRQEDCHLRGHLDTNFFLDARDTFFLNGRNRSTKFHRFQKGLGVQRQVEFNLMTSVCGWCRVDGVHPAPPFQCKGFLHDQSCFRYIFGTLKIHTFGVKLQMSLVAHLHPSIHDESINFDW